MKPLDESIEEGCRKYCAQVAASVSGIDEENRPLLEALLHAAYMSGASQITGYQCRMDGSPDVTPQKCVEAIERAANRVIGQGSEPPRKS